MNASETRLYRVLAKMKERCYNPNCKDFPRYGGRGIRVCDEWRQSFAAFEAWALAAGFQDHLTIDRRDNDGNYTPDNCRWVDGKQQARNRSSNYLVTAWGETKSLTEWAEDPRCVVGHAALRDRVTQQAGRFADLESMMTTPARVYPLVTAWGETKSMSAWAKDPRCAVPKSTLRARLYGGSGAGYFTSIEEILTLPPRPPGIRKGRS